MPAVSMSLRSESVVEMRPRGFLGEVAFADYRKAAGAAARFDRENNCQICPVSRYSELKAAMIAAGFQVVEDRGIAGLVASEVRAKAARVESAKATMAAVDAKRTLFPYQREGVEFLASRTRALLADQPGLGKTVQTLAALPPDAAVIVVCPAVARMVWVDETAVMRPDLHAFRVTGSRLPKPGPGQIAVAGYEDVVRRLLPADNACCDVFGDVSGLAVGGVFEPCAEVRLACESVPEPAQVDVSKEIESCKLCEVMSTCPKHRAMLNAFVLPAVFSVCSEKLDIRDPRVRKHVVMEIADVKISFEGRSRVLRPCESLSVFVPPCTHLITDEAHYLKNRRSQRARAHAKLEAQAKVAWHLTGTPLPNTADELWAVLESIGVAGEAFGSFEEFVTIMGGEYEEIVARGGKKKKILRWPDLRSLGPDAVGQISAEAREKLAKVMLRRKKREVLTQLPAIRHRTVLVDVDASTNRACAKIQERLLEEYGIDVLRLTDEQSIPLREIERLRVALAEAKIPAATEYVESYEAAEEPIIVFSAHQAPVDELGDRKGWAKIHGKTSENKRKAAVRDFQAGKLKGIAATIRAAGTALTLTRAHDALFVDLDWVPANNEQAVNRIDRIGQTEAMLITFLSSSHPMDARVNDVLSKKITAINAIIG